MQFFALDDRDYILAQTALTHKNYLCAECQQIVKAKKIKKNFFYFCHLNKKTSCHQSQKKLPHLYMQIDLAQTFIGHNCHIDHFFEEEKVVVDLFLPEQKLVFYLYTDQLNQKHLRNLEILSKNKDLSVVFLIGLRSYRQIFFHSLQKQIRNTQLSYYFIGSKEKSFFVFDQFEVFKKGCRIFYSLPFSVKLTNHYLKDIFLNAKPLDFLIKSQENTPIFFEGDLLDRFIRGKKLDYLQKIQEENLSRFSFARLIYMYIRNAFLFMWARFFRKFCK
ncbi:MAG: hypothetical protein ACOVOR_00895 [Rhabdochlamydiaceae bacterium]